VLETVFASRAAAEWLDTLRGAGVPCSPVNSVAEALHDEHTAARGMVIETEHPRFGTVRQVRGPVRVGSDEPSFVRAPLRDEHHDSVLRGVLGYSAERVDALESGGAFGGGDPKMPGGDRR
jgi:crotonobetainyl-CoA:carnitine CoA-transferase CaiB-like acyl-CoA transferase